MQTEERKQQDCGHKKQFPLLEDRTMKEGRGEENQRDAERYTVDAVGILQQTSLADSGKKVQWRCKLYNIYIIYALKLCISLFLNIFVNASGKVASPQDTQVIIITRNRVGIGLRQLGFHMVLSPPQIFLKFQHRRTQGKNTTASKHHWEFQTLWC